MKQLKEEEAFVPRVAHESLFGTNKNTNYTPWLRTNGRKIGHFALAWHFSMCAHMRIVVAAAAGSAGSL